MWYVPSCSPVPQSPTSLLRRESCWEASIAAWALRVGEKTRRWPWDIGICCWPRKVRPMTCLRSLGREEIAFGDETMSMRGNGAVKCLKHREGASQAGVTAMIVVAAQKQPPYSGALTLQKRCHVRERRETQVWRRWSEVVRGGSHESSFPAGDVVWNGRALLEQM
jgi:hypothetical protein